MSKVKVEIVPVDLGNASTDQVLAVGKAAGYCEATADFCNYMAKNSKNAKFKMGIFGIAGFLIGRHIYKKQSQKCEKSEKTC